MAESQRTIRRTGRENGARILDRLTWPGSSHYAPEAVIGRVSQDLNSNETIWGSSRPASNWPVSAQIDDRITALSVAPRSLTGTCLGITDLNIRPTLSTSRIADCSRSG